MTPRPLDWRSVRPKLRKIDELLAVLAGLGPVDAERLRTELTTALAVERVLSLVVELAFSVNTHIAVARLGRAPDSYAESFSLVAQAGALDEHLARSLVPSAGMRNVLVHAYLDVDHEIVAAAVPRAIEGYGAYARGVAAWFRDLPPEVGGDQRPNVRR